MKKPVLLLALASLFIFKGAAFAQDHEVDLNQLTNETQIMSDDPDLMQMVWYIPIEYWKAVFDQDPSISAADAREVIKALEQYELFSIVDGEIGVFGNIKYRSERDIRSSLKLTGPDEQVYYALDDSEIDSDAQGMINIFAPLLSNMMGELGSNMHFFFFKSKSGRRIAKPKGDGKMVVNLGDEVFDFKFPFGSLMPMKICTVTGEERNGAWTYCPFHGVKLVEKKN